MRRVSNLTLNRVPPECLTRQNGVSGLLGGYNKNAVRPTSLDIEYYCVTIIHASVAVLSSDSVRLRQSALTRFFVGVLIVPALVDTRVQEGPPSHWHLTPFPLCLAIICTHCFFGVQGPYVLSMAPGFFGFYAHVGALIALEDEGLLEGVGYVAA